MNVRQAALVTSGAEGEAARRWVAEVPGLAVAFPESLESVAWSRTEVVWVHGPVPPRIPLDLTGWLRHGGRLLLTQEAARLPYLLGLEPQPPEHHPAVVTDPAWRGLAAFGSHPLFDGLCLGALTARSSAGTEAWSYRGPWPEAGQVVAVEHQARQLDASHAVAWEYELGDGGALCLGAFASLLESDPLARRQLAHLLHNALVGDGIPHSTRRPVTLWPGADLTGEAPAAPSLPGEVWDEWIPSTSALLVEPGAGDGAGWRLAGRRVQLAGSGDGLAEIVALPRRVAHDFRLEVNGRAPEVVAVRIAPDEVTRVLRAGEVELTERVSSALDHGLVFWGVVADAPVTIRLRWKADLRRAWPYAAWRDSPVVVEPPPGDPAHGRACRVGLPREAPRAEVSVLAGEVSAVPGDGAVRFDARGDRLLRLVFAAGNDEAELVRARDALRRRKLRAFRQDRVLHVRRVEERLVSLDTPAPALDRRFGWAKMCIEGALAETPGLGRGVLVEDAGQDLVGEQAYRAREGTRIAAAALALGDRDLARDQLRFLARLQGEVGSIPAVISPSGMADPLLSDAADAFVALAESYLRWTGDQRWLEGLALPLATARERAGTVPPATAADPDSFTGSAPGPISGGTAAAVVSWVVERLWGAAPDAMAGSLRLVPEWPSAWGEMSLRRLRVGATTLDLRLRRRPGRQLLQLERTGGPPLRVRCRLPGAAAGAITVDEIGLGGLEAAFLLEGNHEVVAEE